MAALDLMRHRGPDDEGYAVWTGRSSRVTAYSGRETDPAHSPAGARAASRRVEPLLP